MRIRVAALVSVLVVAAVSAAVTTYFLEFRKMAYVHTLEYPLILDGSSAPGQNYLLPAGTTLYYDQGFPEGFVRYRVYVNVEGVKLEGRELADPTEISPISAYPVGKAELLKLIREYPLTKNELGSILKSEYLSKDDIKEVLVEFSK